MIVVTDANGDEHEYDGSEATASFETEDLTNNLVVTAPGRYAVFAAGQWVKAEVVVVRDDP